MVNPTEQEIKSIDNLVNNANFQIVVEWFKRSLTDQSIKNNYANGEIAIKGQGRGLELMDILKHIDQTGIYLQNAKEAERMGKK
jgi:hypothetical protein